MNKYPSQFNEKRKDIQIIKIAQKQLRMDDAEYRAILWSIARVKSSTELDFAGRRKVIDHMKNCGFKVAANKNIGKPTRVKPELIPLMSKIGALLADMKLPWKYASAILKRQAKVERLEWASAAQLHDVVTALTVKQQKGVK
ncbi:MAG TPA: regulatory protein GemA [Gallionella sp.]|nr:regulatory protein GemA [Gallionella sp.]